MQLTAMWLVGLLNSLGTWLVVESGSPGHYHVDVKLADDPGPDGREPVPGAGRSAGQL